MLFEQGFLCHRADKPSAEAPKQGNSDWERGPAGCAPGNPFLASGFVFLFCSLLTPLVAAQPL